MPCHDLVCDVSNGERLDLTILECNQPAAARLVTRDSGGILQFNHTFTQSGIVHITVSGTAVTLNVTIQHLKGGTKLGLQVSCTRKMTNKMHEEHACILFTMNVYKESFNCEFISALL